MQFQSAQRTNARLLRRQRMVGTLLKRIRELEEANRALVVANRELTHRAQVDAVTGIANRHGFALALEREWRRAARHGAPLALVLIDIDFFKAYNDRYGHVAGDACLAAVATYLAGEMKRGGDLVARYGGEEFVALLTGTDAAGAAIVAERLRAGVESLAIAHERSPVSDVLTISLGVASVRPHPGSEPQRLVTTADRNLYAAKLSGRNRVVGASRSEGAGSRE